MSLKPLDPGAQHTVATFRPIQLLLNAINLEAAPAIFYWPAASFASKKRGKIVVFWHSEAAKGLKIDHKPQSHPIFGRFFRYQSDCRAIEYRGSSYGIDSVQFAALSL
jgi:hypothetical protein